MSRHLRKKIAKKLGFGYNKRDVLVAESKGYQRAVEKYFEKGKSNGTRQPR